MPRLASIAAMIALVPLSTLIARSSPLTPTKAQLSQGSLQLGDRSDRRRVDAEHEREIDAGEVGNRHQRRQPLAGVTPLGTKLADGNPSIGGDLHGNLAPSGDLRMLLDV